MDYEAKKFGEHSYIITLTTIKPGEYGIIVNNPNLQRDDSNIIVYSNAKGACMQITDDMTSVV